jgi:hypothetical protein
MGQNEQRIDVAAAQPAAAEGRLPGGGQMTVQAGHGRQDCLHMLRPPGPRTEVRRGLGIGFMRLSVVALR